MPWMRRGHALRLVGGERVHRVDEDGLDARLAGVAGAPVEDGEQEALGLARARARGDERGLGALAAEAVEGAALVAVGAEAEADVLERLAGLLARRKGRLRPR